MTLPVIFSNWRVAWTSSTSCPLMTQRHGRGGNGQGRRLGGVDEVDHDRTGRQAIAGKRELRTVAADRRWRSRSNRNPRLRMRPDRPAANQAGAKPVHRGGGLGWRALRLLPPERGPRRSPAPSLRSPPPRPAGPRPRSLSGRASR